MALNKQHRLSIRARPKPAGFFASGQFRPLCHRFRFINMHPAIRKARRELLRLSRVHKAASIQDEAAGCLRSAEVQAHVEAAYKRAASIVLKASTESTEWHAIPTKPGHYWRKDAESGDLSDDLLCVEADELPGQRFARDFSVWLYSGPIYPPNK